MEKSGMKRRILVMVTGAIVALLTAVGVRLYVTQYYFPMRDAKPVLELLERGALTDLEETRDVLLNGPGLQGPGADKVRQAMLKKLASSDDPEALLRLFSVLLAGQNKNHLVFDRQHEWEVIKGATARYNAKQPDGCQTFFVSTNGDGRCYLNLSGWRVP